MAQMSIVGQLRSSLRRRLFASAAAPIRIYELRSPLLSIIDPTMTLRPTIDKTRLRDLTDEQIAFCHLLGGNRIWTADFVVETGLEYIEIEMRQARGRDLTSRYVPMMAAFAILDQIGTTYRNPALPAAPAKTPAIKKALYYFGGYKLTDPDVEYLYALRNALVHDAALTGHNLKKTVWYIFRFNLEMDDIIRLPASGWDGDPLTLKTDCLTWINPRLFTDSVSALLRQLRQAFEADPSSVAIEVPGHEILQKYLFWTPRPSAD